MRKRVYIAGPISKGILLDNLQQADEAMADLMAAGFAVFNPMLSCYAGGAAMDVRGTYAVASRVANGRFADFTHGEWLDMDFAWVAVSDAVLRLPGASTGADREVAHATSLGIPVFHSLGALTAHFATQEAA